MTKKNTSKEQVAKNSIDEEEGLDLEELQSVFTEDGDESIDSSDEEESPFQLLLKTVSYTHLTLPTKRIV